MSASSCECPRRPFKTRSGACSRWRCTGVGPTTLAGRPTCPWSSTTCSSVPCARPSPWPRRCVASTSRAAVPPPPRSWQPTGGARTRAISAWTAPSPPPWTPRWTACRTACPPTPLAGVGCAWTSSSSHSASARPRSTRARTTAAARTRTRLRRRWSACSRHSSRTRAVRKSSSTWRTARWWPRTLRCRSWSSCTSAAPRRRSLR
mmetsp:Transcript_12637/g.38010  ORF Transcript_12637/g.38010 Transcript_12637/m.38010 type:complete len:205 (+) Transcript_12637:967-1581(+)